MKRYTRTLRRKFAVEILETRSLMTGSATDIFVRFTADNPPAREQAELRSLGASVVASFPDGPELIQLGQGVTPSVAVGKLEADPGVVYASPDSTIHVASVAPLPNDPALNQDWGFNNPNNVDIDAPEAWQVTLGSSSTIIAVIDTGIDLNNPDFAGKIWTNPHNDFKTGYPNDVHGWNFINNTPDVQDDDGHGTHVSAVIAATANNSDGIAGIDPAARIMPLKFLDANGNGTTDAAVSAIYFAVNHGAKVINASWGGVAASAPLQDAIAFANAHNVVFVTAAGNNGTNNDSVPSFPSSYRDPNELSVAAVDRNGNLPSFSNYGATTVDLAAPGVDIVSEVPTSIDPSGLESLSGTSMSTAYVSGVAALVSGFNPKFTAAQIVQRIDSTTKALPSLAGKTISGGMVDAYNALVGNSGTIAVGSTSSALSTQSTVRASILASDESFAVHGGSEAGFLTGLYKDVLGREPDPAGLQTWEGLYNSGMDTRLQIAQSFVTSLEGRLTEVARWYQQDLGRTASLQGLKADPGVLNWAEQLTQGTGDNTIQAEILSSPEFLADHGSASAPFVEAIYQVLTDRAADAAGLSFWVGQLSQGVTPYQMIRSFQSASEVADTLVANFYSDDLKRPGSIARLKADPDIQSWAAGLGNF